MLEQRIGATRVRLLILGGEPFALGKPARAKGRFTLRGGDDPRDARPESRRNRRVIDNPRAQRLGLYVQVPGEHLVVVLE